MSNFLLLPDKLNDWQLGPPVTTSISWSPITFSRRAKKSSDIISSVMNAVSKPNWRLYLTLWVNSQLLLMSLARTKSKYLSSVYACKNPSLMPPAPAKRSMNFIGVLPCLNSSISAIYYLLLCFLFFLCFFFFLGAIPAAAIASSRSFFSFFLSPTLLMYSRLSFRNL